MKHDSDRQKTIHASCVALGNSAVLLTGPSGSGKSALALELMALGADLIADDRTVLTVRDTGLIASCPPSIRGRIEVRGVGLLVADTVAQARVVLAIDLGVSEDERLPPLRHKIVLGHSIPLLHTPAHRHFPAAIVQYLKGGRSA